MTGQVGTSSRVELGGHITKEFTDIREALGTLTRLRLHSKNMQTINEMRGVMEGGERGLVREKRRKSDWSKKTLQLPHP